MPARALAEAGLNYAFSTLYNSSTPTMGNAVASRTITLETGDTSYYGTLTGNTWKLVGVGTVRNPTGPGSHPVVRTVSGRASISTAQHGTDNNAVWNYVYVDHPTSTTELGNSVDINIPLYTRGNLRLLNSAQVSGYALQTMGWLELNNTSHVGTAAAKIHEAHIAGGCRLGVGGSLVKPCGTGQSVYADISDSTTTNFTKPPVDLKGWYFNALPGPRHACTTGSFPGGFDNDSTPNNSRGAVDLLPNLSYDCRVYDGFGALVGQLTWNATAHTLTMHGTIYFDGPIQFRNLSSATYSGRATIYAAGNITFANSTTLCGDPECDADWHPQREFARVRFRRQRLDGELDPVPGRDLRRQRLLRGQQLDGVGPIIARRVSFANSSVNHYVPIGTLMPGMPANYEDVVTITNEPGSWG